MTKLIYLLIITVLVVSCNKTSNAIEFSCTQNGKTIKPINGTLTLDKEAFNLVFNFSEHNFILVNAAFNNDFMFKALNGEALTTQPQFTIGNIIAETYFNTEESIYASNESSSAWLQESEDKHMFNTLDLKNGSYTATRIIKNIFDLDANQNIEIEDINTPLYLVFVVIDKNTDLKNNIELQRIAIKIEWTNTNGNTKENRLAHKFNNITNNIRIKNTPLVDSTNFDNILEPKILSKKETNVLQLGKIYPNFYTDGYNFRSSIGYKLNVSEKFNTIVLSVFKGDHELESVLVNYDLEGQIIDHKVIAYDEIAEGFTWSTSRIGNQVISKNTTWSNDKQEEIEFFKIEDDGTIKTIDFFDVVLNNLDIDKNDVFENFFAIEDITYLKKVVLIATIAKQAEDEFVLDAYVAIVNAKTGEIQSKFISKNNWYSDAIEIYAIEIDYNPYKIAENSETIGVTAFYNGSSGVNPYLSKEFTLLIRNEDVLEPFLKDFEIYKLNGENDGEGNGTTTENTKTIIPEEARDNVFYNLKITDVITEKETINRVETIISKIEVTEYLKYNNLKYD